jgi:hypothetical protein
LASFTGTETDGATATESVAACICRGLRRQYAIDHCLHVRAGIQPASRYYLLLSRAKYLRSGLETLDFGYPGAV